MDFKRVTVESVVKAYEVTGLKPVNKVWVEDNGIGDRCGCALTALYVQQCNPDFNKIISAAENCTMEDILEISLGLTWTYINGFTGGFDDRKSDSEASDWIQGFEDGKAARLAVFGEGGGL